MTLLFANNATSNLAAAISSSATTVTLTTGTGALFPAVGGFGSSGTFQGTLTDAATQTLIEIVTVTARSGDVLTVTRAQEGTAALAWSFGDIFVQRVTALDLSSFQQVSNNYGRINGPPIQYDAVGTSTFSLPAGTRYVEFEIGGGGGGGGNVPGVSNGTSAVGSGGNSGQVYKNNTTGYTLNQSGHSYTVAAIAAGGANGGTTTLYLSTTAGTQTWTAGGGAAGTAESGSGSVIIAPVPLQTFNCFPGTIGIVSTFPVPSTNNGQGGTGGSVPYQGVGGVGGQDLTTAAPGGNAYGCSAGGGGAMNVGNATGASGGNGGVGYVLLRPYY